MNTKLKLLWIISIIGFVATFIYDNTLISCISGIIMGFTVVKTSEFLTRR